MGKHALAAQRMPLGFVHPGRKTYAHRIDLDCIIGNKETVEPWYIPKWRFRVNDNNAALTVLASEVGPSSRRTRMIHFAIQILKVLQEHCQLLVSTSRPCKE